MAILDFYCQSSYWQINWQIYPPPQTGIQQQRMAILDFYCQSNSQILDQLADHADTPHRCIEWQRMQFQISNVRLYWQISNLLTSTVSSYWQINWHISTPWERHLVAKNGNFRFLLLDFILADQLADLPQQTHIQQQRMGILDFYCQFILADQQFQISTISSCIGRSTSRSPPIDTSSSKEWQFQISTVSSYWQINWQIYPPQTHLVAKNGDFRFLLLGHNDRSAILDFCCQFILADQLADLPSFRCIQQQRMAILDFYCQS